MGFIQAECSSCHPTNSIKALKETQSTDPKPVAWPHHLLLNTKLLKDVAPFTLALQCQYQNYVTSSDEDPVPTDLDMILLVKLWLQPSLRCI